MGVVHIKLSVYTVCTPEYDIPQTVKLAAELGCEGIEWRVGEPPPQTKPAKYTYENRYWSYNFSTLDIKTIDDNIVYAQNLCNLNGLKIICLSTNLSPWAAEDMERVFKAAGSIGCRFVRIWISDYNGKENYNRLFARTLEQFKILVKIAEAYNIRMLVETHPKSIIPSASAAYRFVSNFSPERIGVIFDAGNMVQEGFENYKLGLELLGEYTAHVHLKNGAWKLSKVNDDGVEVWKPYTAPMKKGIVDIGALIGLLKQVGYDGYLSLEDFSNEQDTYTKLKDDAEFIRRFL